MAASRNLLQVDLALNMLTAPNPLQMRAEKLEIMFQDCKWELWITEE